MKIVLLPSALSAAEPQAQYLTSFLINDTVAIDAGGIGFRSLDEQARIQHIVLSHSHMDHVASLPIFVENAYAAQAGCVTVHASNEVLDCLRRHFFNDRVWADLIRLGKPDAPFLQFSPLQAHQPLEVAGLRITPVPVDHTVPTFGFIVEDRDAAVAFSSDTGPTQEIWRRANQAPNLKAVFLEVSFPNSMKQLAELTRHLTPELFAAELGKLDRAVPAIAVHLKARYRAQIINELSALGLPQIQTAQSGVPYTFP
jgi:cAMP phosphodiesterase